jgi:hypothetical protein
MPKKRKPKAVCDEDRPLTPITAKERREIRKSIKKKYDGFRREIPGGSRQGRDALLSFATCHWRLSWISPRSTVSPRCDTALKTWKKNASPRTALKRDCRIGFVAASD